MIQFLAALSILYYHILRVPKKLKKKNQGHFRGTVWFWNEFKSEIYLNCYNSRNICHSEEWRSVL